MGAWWSALQTASPFALRLEALVPNQPEPILAALSDSYLEMLSAELIALPIEVLSRLRIFTRAPEHRVADQLRPYLMPYDDRLDGPDSPIRGTRSDFASRALHHFVSLRVSGSVRGDQMAVAEAIGEWRMPTKFDRARHDDAGMLTLMRNHWDAAGGSATRLLRMLRDDLSVACEQSRFATLARQVRAERA